MIATETLSRYLADHGLLHAPDAVAVRELGGGVSNLVWLVEVGERRMVVKQSLEKLRVKDDWRSDRARIFREAEAIQALRTALGDAVPEVLHIDRPNHLYVMTAAPAGSVVWKDLLLAGDVDLGVARQAGSLLARMGGAGEGHLTGTATQDELALRFRDRTVFDQLRIDPYYRTTAARVPEVSAEIRQLIDDSWRIRSALVHGDYSPKNMLVRDGCVFLIDFEVVHWGDPAFDSGFLWNHLLLKAFHQPRYAQFYFSAAREFWKTLVAGIGPLPAGDFENMTIRHLGALMLARIDGKSPVEYIRDDETKDRVRRTAIEILRGRPQKLEEVTALAAGAMG